MSPNSEKPPIPTPDQPLKAENPFSGQVEQEAVKNFAEPTPLDQLIPGIDLSKLTTKEKLEKYHRQAIERTTSSGLMGFGIPSGDSDIGRNQSDTDFMSTARVFAGVEGIVRLENKEKISRYRGKIIIDIGSGESKSSYELAEFLEAKAYIAVDPFAARNTEQIIKNRTRKNTHWLNGVEMEEENEEFKAKKNLIPWNCVESDGLDFLEALPPNSVCVFMSGINSGVIPEKHLGAILKEIERVLAPDGAFFSSYSDTHEAENIMDLDPEVNREDDMKQFIKRKAVV